MTTPRWLAVVVIVGAVGYASGRHAARAPDETRHEAATETIAESTTQEVAREETTHTEAQEAQERVVYRERIVYRDGPVQVVEREVEGERAVAQAVTDTHAAEVRVEVQEVEVVREVERRVEIHTPLPDWIAGPMLGVDVDLGGTRTVYGAMGAYRIGGPLHLGLSLATSGSDLQLRGLALATW